MIREIVRTPHFKRDYKALLKKHFDSTLLEAALVTLVAQDAELLRTRYEITLSKENGPDIENSIYLETGFWSIASRKRNCSLSSRERGRITICSRKVPNDQSTGLISIAMLENMAISRKHFTGNEIEEDAGRKGHGAYRHMNI